MIEVVALVDELGSLRSRDETMREASRNEELPPVVGGQHYPNPAPESLRTNAYIDRDIKNLTRDHPA